MWPTAEILKINQLDPKNLNVDSYVQLSTAKALKKLRVKKHLNLIDLFTFVLEHIMSITGDATEDGICVFRVSIVDFLGLHIKPVLIRHKTIPENVIKNGRDSQSSFS